MLGLGSSLDLKEKLDSIDNLGAKPPPGLMPSGSGRQAEFLRREAPSVNVPRYGVEGL